MSKSGGTSENITSNSTVKLGGDGSFVNLNAELEPVTVNANLAVTQPIVTQSTANSTSTANLDLKVEPLDLKVEPLDLKIEPLKVSTDSEIDVKPLAVDSCSTIKLAPLPPIRMEQPYSQHFGITYMGVELWGITVSGRSETFLHSPPKDRPLGGHGLEPCDCGRDHEAKRKTEIPRQSGGLRVRVK
jgi:hypothetical protein